MSPTLREETGVIRDGEADADRSVCSVKLPTLDADLCRRSLMMGTDSIDEDPNKSRQTSPLPQPQLNRLDDLLHPKPDFSVMIKG